MKKIISVIIALALLIVVPFSFVACNKYARKSYSLSSFTIVKGDGQEANIAEYKKFLGITYGIENKLATEYDKSILDIASVKECFMYYNTYTFDFDSNNGVTFTHTELLNNVLKEYQTSVYTGKYTYENNILDMKFTDYKYDESGNIVVSSLGNEMTEETNVINGFTFGDAKGSMFFTRIDDSSFMVTMYAGVSATATRVEMIFKLVK